MAISTCVSLTGMATWCGSRPLSGSRRPTNFSGPLRRTGSSPRAVLDSSHLEVERVQHDLSKFLTPVISKKIYVKEMVESVAGAMKSAVVAARTELINAFVDLAFKPSGDQNANFQGNFAPVAEIGNKTPVQIISGEIPADFPAGVYIRNGPNPQFGGNITTSPFGKSLFHWFEGDGMLHAIYFDKDGGVPKYLNKFVGTHGYNVEKERGKMTYLTTVEGDAAAIGLSYLFNQLRFGLVNKTTCNTAIFEIGGKLYANAEGGLPHQIDPSSLSTVGVYDVNGGWDRPFTSHPKKDLKTGEVVVFGFAAVKPFFEVGVISADGERLVHEVDLGLDRAIFSHEVAITEKYNIILDWPLIVDVDRLQKGGNLMSFDGDSYARIGVLPRYGDASTMKWFKTEMNYTFHVLNSYDDGDEVVLLGLRSRVSILPSKPGMDKGEWFARGLTPCKMEDAADPWVDGALFTRLHEWRINMKTDNLVERDLTGDNYSLEMPRLNDKYMSTKNRYGYCNAHNLEDSRARSMPMYDKLLKLDFESVPCEGSASGSNDLAKVQVHEMGPNQYASEPLFVARPGGVKEDDGWIVTYVHNESTNISEMIIIDAQKFEDKPIVRMHLPQRVPYGFHSTYVLPK